MKRSVSDQAVGTVLSQKRSLDELAAAVARLRQVMEDAHAGMPAG